MYKTFYHLKENPFSLNPDPHFLFPSQQHKNAFKYLMYGIKNCEGLIEVVGEVGCGKTLLCRRILAALKGSAKTAYILNPPPTEMEFLESLMGDLGLPAKNDNRQELVQNLSSFLAEECAHDSRVVVIIDEAQELSRELFGAIRFLSNLETEKKKLIQIVLVGQLELETRLHSPELKALDQRIALRYQLTPFNKKELEQYIYHRLKTAGTEKIKFTRAALNKIYRFSRGVPRLINMVCDKTLVVGASCKQTKIDGKMVAKALKSTQKRWHEHRVPALLSPWRLAGGFAFASILFLLALNWYSPKKTVSLTPAAKPRREVAKTSPARPPVQLPKAKTLKRLGNLSKAQAVRLQPEAIALVNLLRRWGYELGSDESAGWPVKGNRLDYQSVAREYGLEAALLQTNFKQLLNLNLPCVIFPGRQGKGSLPSALLLSKLSGEQIHSQDATYPLQKLDSWRGRALIFWKNTDDFRAGEIALDKSSLELRRLAKRLQQLGYLGKKKTNKQQVRRALMNFQRDHSLSAKAVIDPQTKLVLYKIINQPMTPTLGREFI